MRDVLGCDPDCKFYGKDIPRNMPTPACRLFEKYHKEKNPVTKAVIREIIQKRLRCGVNDG